jgi:hypothetical protein
LEEDDKELAVQALDTNAGMNKRPLHERCEGYECRYSGAVDGYGGRKMTFATGRKTFYDGEHSGIRGYTRVGAPERVEQRNVENMRVHTSKTLGSQPYLNQLGNDGCVEYLVPHKHGRESEDARTQINKTLCGEDPVQRGREDRRLDTEVYGQQQGSMGRFSQVFNDEYADRRDEQAIRAMLQRDVFFGKQVCAQTRMVQENVRSGSSSTQERTRERQSSHDDESEGAYTLLARGSQGSHAEISKNKPARYSYGGRDGAWQGFPRGYRRDVSGEPTIAARATNESSDICARNRHENYERSSSGTGNMDRHCSGFGGGSVNRSRRGYADCRRQDEGDRNGDLDGDRNGNGNQP